MVQRASLFARLGEKMKWIWLQEKEKNAYADFVYDFSCERNGKVSVRVASTNNYVLYFNGRFVGCGQYQSYPEKKYYDEYFVEKKEGINRLAIIGMCLNKHSDSDGRGICFEIIDGVKTYSSNETILCRKSKVYRSGATHKVVSSYEVVRDERLSDGFEQPKTPLHGFEKATVMGESTLYSRPVAKLNIGEPRVGALRALGLFVYGEQENNALRMQHAYLSAKRAEFFGLEYGVEERYPFEIRYGGKEGIYMLFDLGEESTGYLDLDVFTEEETLVDYCWGEHFDDLRVRAEISTRHFSGSVTLRKGRNRITEYFCRMGLRYLMLYFQRGNFILYHAGILPSYYPTDDRAFAIENYIERKIFERSVHTLKCCMHEHYEDCPWREQAQYVMDSRNQILSGFYAFKNTEFAKASIRLMSDRIFDDGNLPLIQPNDSLAIDGTERGNFVVLPRRDSWVIPDFTLCYFLLVKDYVEYTGDKAFLEELWDRLTFVVESFEKKIDEKGLMPSPQETETWNFFEWTKDMANAFGDHPMPAGAVQYALPNQAFLAIALEIYADFAKRLGYDAQEKRNKATELKKNTRKMFYSEDKKRYNTYVTNGISEEHYAEYTQVMALYSGISTGKEAERLAALLTNENSGLQKLSLSNYLYKYETLLSMGDIYRSFVKKEIQEVWGKMLLNGATSFYEVEEGADAFFFAGSLCHGWSAIPVYIYGKYKLFDEKEEKE